MSEKIKLDNSQWRNLVQENYLEIDNENIDIKVVQDEYDDSNRHTESHHLVFKRLSDNKFFKVYYEVSVKDSMGWEECNYGDIEISEVFPETITRIIYKG